MATMTINQFISTAPLLPKGTSLLIRGPHGIGKSEVLRLLARLINERDGIDRPVIDRRLSQMSEGDMIGLPSTDGECTRFNPPDWYKRACDAPAVLLLDEINRASQEVIQSAFQIVLDGELNGWPLHPDTVVYSAINDDSRYTVNQMDPALLDRFWVVDLFPDLNDWIKWAEGEGNVHETVTSFIKTSSIFLDPATNADLNTVQPSRRSWKRLNDTLVKSKLIDTPEDPMFYNVSIGFVGVEAASAFQQYARDENSRISGEEILNSYTKIRKRIKKLGQERWNVVIDRVETVVKDMDELTPAQVKNLAALVGDVPSKELVIKLWTSLITHGVKKPKLAEGIHKALVKDVVAVFGVKVGPEGVNMPCDIPNITGLQSNAT
jgi:energy-coupling factor transporter ATP-binding protein EcfA2